MSSPAFGGQGGRAFPPSSSSAYPAASSPSAGVNGVSLPTGAGAGATIVDPLNFESLGAANAGIIAGDSAARDVDDTASNVGGGGTRSGRRRIRQQVDNISRVKDATGEKVMESFTIFLENFTESISLTTGTTPSSLPPSHADDSTTTHFYLEQIKAMKEFELTTLYVDFSHLLEREEVLANAVRQQYYRFLPYLRRSIQLLIRKYSPTYQYLSTTTTPSSSASAITRDFSVAFYNLPLVSSIRDLKMDKIGQLTSISGTVTRTSEVRPELVAGWFRCEECRTVIEDVEQQFKYTEPAMCQNATCSNRASWHLLIEQSKFSDWQKVRIQENANEIPTGSMPRSLDVILRSEIVERAKAGDKCTFTGTFIVVPDVSQLGLPGVNAEMMRQAQGGGGGGRDAGGIASQGVTGLKALGVRDLQYKTAFLGCMVQQADSRGSAGGIRGDENSDEDQDAFLNSLTPEELDELKNMVNTDHIYQRLVQSIAPTVYGHEIVKKGILLQLMGGVHKQTGEGINLRGDINVCIVGDPSVSKSQFLKYVCGFLPRAVYTSGKASSAAGLTAAVVRDEESGEFTIEAGALMLADNGICAIDEFDKMDISDQVAIHEAMEQQTISIAKAGIQATLNARTSILAAANPVGGRYNRKISLRANVAMSAPIMSRFDLFFVVLDECNEAVDMNIAQHIVNVHRYRDAAISPEFSTESLQRYIAYARTFKPKLTTAASAVLVEKYRQLRQDDSGIGGKNSYRITVRQLESMIRLSEAIARANCSKEVTPQFVREAFALLRQSIIHVEQDDIDFDEDEDAQGGGDDVDGDVPMDEGEADAAAAALDQAEASYNASSLLNGNDSSSLPGPSSQPAGQASTAAPSQKKKTKITYNKYMEVMNLCVLHLSEVERETGAGVDRDELIEWYLEQKEDEFASVEALDDERELIGKALKKLVKDDYLMELRGQGGEGLAPATADESVATDPGKIHYVVHPQVDLSDLQSSLGA